VVAAGCSTGSPSVPDAGTVGAFEPIDPVGPSPLRRLTDHEVLHALNDLFPGVNAALPALPLDVPVAGFDNAAEAQRPSDVLIARYEGIANIYAEALTVNDDAVRALVGCADWSTPALASACATTFLTEVGARVFRRPLTSDELTRFSRRFQSWMAAVDFSGAVQLSVSALLQSPQFLYRLEPVPPDAPPGTRPLDPYVLATRLSFFLWESVPDDALLQAAAANELRTDDQLSAQVARMLQDPKAKRVYWSFNRQWLGLDQILLPENLSRTPQVDPGWTGASQTSANQETELFVENVLAGGGTLGDLLTSRRAWVNGEMARIYGLPTPASPVVWKEVVPTAWREVMLPASERAGLLTRASFLASTSHAGATSPPIRGNAVQLRLLCQLPVSPPPNADLSQPMAKPGQGPETNRMLFAARTAPPGCQACHAGLNGFGFGFENYNAAGEYHTTEVGLPIDASGTISGTDVDGPFVGGVELSQALGRSETVHTCATQAMVRYAFGRAPAYVEAPTVAAMAKDFMASGGDLRALMLQIVLSPSFRNTAVEEK
jgi:hypothetical protein